MSPTSASGPKISLLLLFKCVAHYEPFLSSGTVSHNMVKCWCHHFVNSDANADNVHPGDPTTGMDAGNYCDDVIKWKHLPRYWPFVRGIHRSQWILRTKASDVELWCFLWSAPEWTVEKKIVKLMIWDAIAPIMTSLEWCSWSTDIP